MKVPKPTWLEPKQRPGNAFLSDQSMASNPRKGQAERLGAKIYETTAQIASCATDWLKDSVDSGLGTKTTRLHLLASTQ